MLVRADVVGGPLWTRNTIAIAWHIAVLEAAGKTEAPEGYDELRVGLPTATGVEAIDVYLDDIIVAIFADLAPGPRIGCL